MRDALRGMRGWEKGGSWLCDAVWCGVMRCGAQAVEVRTRLPMKEGTPWIPLSIVKGGQSANVLVQYMANDWGNKLWGKTLIRNIAAGVYKVGPGAGRGGGPAACGARRAAPRRAASAGSMPASMWQCWGPLHSTAWRLII